MVALIGARGRAIVDSALVVLSLSALAACSPYVARGTTLYSEGRYIEAAEVFERTENRLAESAPDEQAEYGLYRGLTMLRLGDQRRAREWLSYASRVAHAHPGILDEEQQALLSSGWERLEAAPQAPAGAPSGEIARATDPSATAAPSNGQRSVPDTATP